MSTDPKDELIETTEDLELSAEDAENVAGGLMMEAKVHPDVKARSDRHGRVRWRL